VMYAEKCVDLYVKWGFCGVIWDMWQRRRKGNIEVILGG
jgi:hypothetical protein